MTRKTYILDLRNENAETYSERRQLSFTDETIAFDRLMIQSGILKGTDEEDYVKPEPSLAFSYDDGTDEGEIDNILYLSGQTSPRPSRPVMTEDDKDDLIILGLNLPNEYETSRESFWSETDHKSASEDASKKDLTDAITEDQLILERIQEATTRKVFTMEVGNMSEEEAIAFLARVKAELENK